MSIFKNGDEIKLPSNHSRQRQNNTAAGVHLRTIQQTRKLPDLAGFLLFNGTRILMNCYNGFNKRIFVAY